MTKTAVPWLKSPKDFPDTKYALKNPPGLLAASLQISADWLQASYARGIFPWYSQGEPVLWWSTSPRAVLYTDEFKLHRSLHQTIKKIRCNSSSTIRLNTAFEAVIRGCAAPRRGQDRTWITEDLLQSYMELHRRGFAHSIEHWQENRLVGGLYCVALGGMVYGESMFSIEANASKVAFAYFVYWLKAQNVHIIDCQQATGHLMSLGARTVCRTVFESEMATSLAQPPLNWEPHELTWNYDQT